MLCDCDTCCDTCGHDTNCMSQQTPAADPSDDYTR
jgi:hypothetical protein